MPNHPLAPVYIISSDDPFLKKERSDALVRQARATLNDPVLMVFTQQDFGTSGKANLSMLENELLDPGLFGGDRIIKIYLGELKSIANQVLTLLGSRTRPGGVCIVETARITKKLADAKALDYSAASAKDKDKATTEKALGFVKGIGGNIEVIYPPDENKFPAWIISKASEFGLTMNKDAVDFLRIAFDGNLGAIIQFFEIICVQYPGANVTLQMVESFLEEDTRHSGFDFINNVLKPDSYKAIAVLHSLMESGSQSVVTLSGIIQSSDKSLKAVAALKNDKAFLNSNPSFMQKQSYFRNLEIYLPATYDFIIKAARLMNNDLYSYLVQELSLASKALSAFNENEAVLHLENMAASVQNIAVRSLRSL